jgi:hypothetical protein
MIVFDRYYVDFDLRNKINEHKSYFTTRIKKNIVYDIIDEKPQINENIYADLIINLKSEN